MRPRFTWRLRNRTLALGERTLIMGVLNVTPDSFSDGGTHFSAANPAPAIEDALRLLDEGADILDIGGESTRPGAQTGAQGVSQQEELRRVMPVLEGVLAQRPNAVISIDTYKAAVARAALEAGAEIVNDVSAGRWDSAMPATMAELKCGVVLMHMRGQPAEWRKLPPISGDDLVALVARELRAWSDCAMSAGVARERIVLDPGFGFGKNFEENYPLLARLGELGELGFPLLAGTSRKGFIGRTLAHAGKDAAVGERLYGSLATVTATILAGAHIVRVHDVKPAVEAARVADAIVAALD